MMMSESGPNAALDAPAGCAPSEGVAGSVCAAPGHGDGCAARRARESDRDCSVDCPATAQQSLVPYADSNSENGNDSLSSSAKDDLNYSTVIERSEGVYSYVARRVHATCSAAAGCRPTTCTCAPCVSACRLLRQANARGEYG